MSATMFALRSMTRTLPRSVYASHSLRYSVSRSMSSYRYLPSHEYVKVEGNIGVIGISDFAQQQLGDVVYVDLPNVGDEFEKGESFGSVESVKAASDVYAPVSGVVVEINEAVGDAPEMVNKSAMTDAWFVKIEMSKSSEELETLLDEKAYEALCQEESE